MVFEPTYCPNKQTKNGQHTTIITIIYTSNWRRPPPAGLSSPQKTCYGVALHPGSFSNHKQQNGTVWPTLESEQAGVQIKKMSVR